MLNILKDFLIGKAYEQRENEEKLMKSSNEKFSSLGLYKFFFCYLVHMLKRTSVGGIFDSRY